MGCDDISEDVAKDPTSGHIKARTKKMISCMKDRRSNNFAKLTLKTKRDAVKDTNVLIKPRVKKMISQRTKKDLYVCGIRKNIDKKRNKKAEHYISI